MLATTSGMHGSKLHSPVRLRLLTMPTSFPAMAAQALSEFFLLY